MTNLPATTNATVTTFEDIQRMGASIAKSGLFGIKTPDQAVALMLIAQAEGRHPAIVARDYDIIQGRPAKKAEAVQRDFIAAGGSIKWHKLDETIADATFSHPQGGEVRITWTLAQAKDAGLASKDNWRKFPRAMLRARCVSEGCRTVCPSSTSGMYVPEEVHDIVSDEQAAKGRKGRDVSPPPEQLPPPATPAEAFTGHRSAREEVAQSGAMSDADAILGDRQANAAAARGSDDDWKERRAIDAGYADRTAQARAVKDYLDDLKGFGLTAEWCATRLAKLEPPRKTLWGLTVDEMKLFHEQLRREGDAGARFKSTGPAEPPQFADDPGGVPPEA